MHAASLATFVVQPGVPGPWLERHSRTSLVAAGALIITLPLVVRFARWCAQRPDASSSWPVTGSHAVWIVALACGLFGMWALGLGSNTPSYLVLRLYLTLVIVTGGLSMASTRTSPNAGKSPDTRLTVSVVAGVGLLLLAVSYFVPFPGVLWTDEGYATSLAQGFFRTGHLEASIFSLAPSMQGPNYSIVYMSLGVVYRLFGVTLGVARVFTLSIGIAGACLLYRTAAKNLSQAAALVAALVIVVALPPINFLRADVALLVYLGLAFYSFSLARPDALHWHLIAGVATGFALDGHPNSYRFPLAFAVAYAVIYGRGFFRQRNYRPIVLLGLGQAIGLTLYVGLYGSIASSLFFDRASHAAFALDLVALPRVWVEQFLSALRGAPLLFGLAIAGIPAAVERRSDLNRLVLIVVLVAPVALGVLYGYYSRYYLLHLFVPFGWLAACAVERAIRQFRREARHAVAVTLVWLLAAAGLGRLAGDVWRDGAQNYHEALEAADWVRAWVPPAATFVGIDPFYLRMVDYPNFVEFNTGAVLAEKGQTSEAAAWARIHPDAVVLVERYPIAMPASLRTYVLGEGFRRAACAWTPKLGAVELYMRSDLLVEPGPHQIPSGSSWRACAP